MHDWGIEIMDAQEHQCIQSTPRPFRTFIFYAQSGTRLTSKALIQDRGRCRLTPFQRRTLCGRSEGFCKTENISEAITFLSCERTSFVEDHGRMAGGA